MPIHVVCIVTNQFFNIHNITDNLKLCTISINSALKRFKFRFSTAEAFPLDRTERIDQSKRKSCVFKYAGKCKLSSHMFVVFFVNSIVIEFVKKQRNAFYIYG